MIVSWKLCRTVRRNKIPTLPSARVLTGQVLKRVNGVVDTAHVAAEKKSMHLSA